jgi:hypothetical protein
VLLSAGQDEPLLVAEGFLAPTPNFPGVFRVSTPKNPQGIFYFIYSIYYFFGGLTPKQVGPFGGPTPKKLGEKN